MPYIKQEQRDDLNSTEFEFLQPETVGELNYCFTLILKNYINVKGLSYQTINDLIGALECCKIELYRRRAVDYEDLKIEENGDVY